MDAPPPSTHGLAAVAATDASTSRTIRLVAALLALTGAVSLIGVVMQWREQHTVPLSPGVLAPIAVWGLLCGRRFGWVTALLIVWTTLLSLLLLTALAVIGTDMSLELLGSESLGLPITDTPRVVLFALLAIGIGFSWWTQWMLIRPDLLRIFRPPESTPWGSFVSLALAGLVITVSQIVGGVAAAWVADLPTRDLQNTSRLIANGTFVTLAALLGTPISVGLVWFCVWLRNGPSVRDYLALRPLSLRAAAAGTGVIVLLTLIESSAYAGLDRPIPEFMVNLYRSAGHPLLLALALVVAAPLSEEVVFRGFLYTGLAGASERAGMAILVTAATFTSAHLGQYGPWELGFLFVFGVALGLARARSASLYLPVVMHMVMNLVALLGTAARLRGVP